MGLLSCAGMRALEEAAFRGGVSAEALMDKAGRRIGEALVRLHPVPGTAVAYLGRGNNGGDALVALRVLRRAGWQVRLRAALPPPELGMLPRRKWRELGEPVLEEDPLSAGDLARPLLVLDGLLGIGARGPVRPPLRDLAAEMNALREEQGATVAAIDLPSGVDGDSGEPHPGAVQADLTLTVGVPKCGLLADQATGHVGRLELVALEELPPPPDGDRLTAPAELRASVGPRPFDFHKGEAGRVAIVAGSRGLLGAALLAACGALRGGAGLVTLFVPEELYPLVLAAGAPPELMVRPCRTLAEDLLAARPDVLAIGPGLGKPEGAWREELLDLLGRFAGPQVVDADALNLIAEEGPARHLTERMLITPHPGEMARLLPVEGDRAATARQFVAQHPATLLYKGARTIVTAPGQPLFYNSTGTPGMASGGQGDVLTGLLAALVGGGLPPLLAARAGAWLAGRASELAVQSDQRQSARSLLATDTAAFLGAAFRDLQEAP